MNRNQMLNATLQGYGYNSVIEDKCVSFQYRSKDHNDICVMAGHMFEIGQLFPEFNIRIVAKYRYTRNIVFWVGDAPYPPYYSAKK